MSALVFPLARYRFEWRATTPVRLPDFAGSMLRGAFGQALRQLACMTRQKECPGCPLLASCPYPAVFAPPPPPEHALQKFSAIPVPYVIEPPEDGARLVAPGESFSFSLVLIGRALAELPLIILAWRRALARGIGPGDGTAELVRVMVCAPQGEFEIHRPEAGTIAPHPQRVELSPPGPAAPERICLHFSTPLRLQNNGRALAPDALSPRPLLMAMVRRASLLAEFHGGGALLQDFRPMQQACAAILDEKELRWRDWTRYSSRQMQKMALGGAVGRWTLRGPLAPFVPYLELGQWLHVGKEAVFGLGRYRLQPSAGQTS
jgi:hypothetical protein